MTASVRHSLLGRSLDGRFVLREFIGRGGMGQVYYGEQLPMGRKVAVKTLIPTIGREFEFMRRFKHEADVASRLRHPHTVTVYDCGETQDGIAFIAMELVDGRTLDSLLDEYPEGVPFGRVVTIARQVCGALQEAHELGIVHRDLKPKNIMLAETSAGGDFAKVLDFGLAKTVHRLQEMTAPGSIMGSPRYVSPEQVLCHQVDGRADLYALGVIMFALLEGRVPFDYSSDAEIVMAHVRERPPRVTRPDVPRALVDLVHACMAKDPNRRPESAAALSDALERVPSEPPPPSITRSGMRLVPILRHGAERVRLDYVLLVLGAGSLLSSIAYACGLLG